MKNGIACLVLMSSPALLGAWGCSKAPAPEASAVAAAPAAKGVSAGAPDAAAAKEAQEIFANRCTPCHGPQGGGDGPASAGFTPKPANFNTAAWQESVSDEHIEQIVQYGGAAVGKSAAMPANPDLMSKPDVVKALREHIRNLKK